MSLSKVLWRTRLAPVYRPPVILIQYAAAVVTISDQQKASFLEKLKTYPSYSYGRMLLAFVQLLIPLPVLFQLSVLFYQMRSIGLEKFKCFDSFAIHPNFIEVMIVVINAQFINFNKVLILVLKSRVILNTHTQRI